MQRRWTWILVVAGTVIIAAAAVAYFSERHADSPAGSLSVLSDAARSGDWAAVEDYMDVDAVATHIAESNVAVATGGAPGDASEPQGDTGMGGGESQTGMMARMATVYAGNFRRILQERVEAGIEPGATGVEGVLVAGKAEDVEYVSDTEARVTIEIPTDDDATVEITATMVRVNDHWQIIALDNLSDEALSAE